MVFAIVLGPTAQAREIQVQNVVRSFSLPLVHMATHKVLTTLEKPAKAKGLLHGAHTISAYRFNGSGLTGVMMCFLDDMLQAVTSSDTPFTFR